MFHVGFHGGRQPSHGTGGGEGGNGRPSHSDCRVAPAMVPTASDVVPTAAAVVAQMLGCRHETMKLQFSCTTTSGCGGLVSGTVSSQTIAYVTVAFPSQVPITLWDGDSQFESHHSVDPPYRVTLRVVTPPALVAGV